MISAADYKSTVRNEGKDFSPKLLGKMGWEREKVELIEHMCPAAKEAGYLSD